MRSSTVNPRKYALQANALPPLFHPWFLAKVYSHRVNVPEGGGLGMLLVNFFVCLRRLACSCACTHEPRLLVLSRCSRSMWSSTVTTDDASFFHAPRLSISTTSAIAFSVVHVCEAAGSSSRKPSWLSTSSQATMGGRMHNTNWVFKQTPLPTFCSR